MLLETHTSLAGITREYHTDDDIGLYAIIKPDNANLQRNIDFCKAAQNNYDTAANKNDIRQLASIPMVLYLKILTEKGIDNIYSEEAADVVTKEFLHNPKYMTLRVNPHRVSIGCEIARGRECAAAATVIDK